MIKTRYIVLITGTLINFYGQIIVPYFRGERNPIELIGQELINHPVLFSVTVIMAYIFPLCVSLVTTESVIKHYKVKNSANLTDAQFLTEHSEISGSKPSVGLERASP